MFYCNGCANKNGYPITIFRSRGACEVCGNVGSCSELHHSILNQIDRERELDRRRKENNPLDIA